MSEVNGQDMANILEDMNNNQNVQPMIDLIEQVMAIPDESLTDETIEIVSGMMAGALTKKVRQESKNSIITNFDQNGYTRAQAIALVDAMKNELNALVEEIKPSEAKKKLLNNIFAEFYSIFDEVVEHYHGYAFVLNMTLEEGAKTPTYAHETDAAADLYARETVVVPAHSISNQINTGVHIALPEGWQAHIAPRSSIGAKTPLRLSNNLGLIDQGYRGPLIVLFDNISDSDYTINAGDRIAQLWVTHSYRFKVNVVDNLDNTDRNNGGLGSTGV